MVTRSPSIRNALRRGGVVQAVTATVEALAAQLDAELDPKARLTLTRAFLAAARDLSVHQRAEQRRADAAAKTAPKAPSEAEALVLQLRRGGGNGG